MRRFLFLLVAVGMVFLAAQIDQAASAQPGLNARATDHVGLYAGPGPDYAIMTVLAPGTELDLQGRNAEATWLWGAAQDGTNGWVDGTNLDYAAGFDAAKLPVTSTVIDPDAAVAAAIAETEQFLNRVPVLPISLSPRTHDIYQQGQNSGKQARVFTLVGDCNSDTRAFLFPFDTGRYDLGPYSDLQVTVDYYQGSFSRDSIAGTFGYSTLNVLDPLFAPPALCQPGESSVACEYRTSRPSAAIIMFGANDMLALTPEQYADAMRQIVTETISAGIIPVLNTFPWCPSDRNYDKALALNKITVDLAAEYQIPLVNFWRAAQALPNCGFAVSTHHLSEPGPAGSAPHATFTGDEQTKGATLRNLLTLQILDLIRREVE